MEIQGHSPLRNQQVVRVELKRQLIEMLTGEAVNGYDLVADRDHPRASPQTTVVGAIRTGT